MSRLKLPALDPAGVEAERGSTYPSVFDVPVAAREKQRLGEACGLTNFGVNRVRIPAGTTSSQRHWHTRQDEFIMVLQGELVLLTEQGEQVLTAGMCAGFPRNSGDGHALVNRSDRDAIYLEVGDRTAGDEVIYADIDMEKRIVGGVSRYVHKDGTPY